MLLGIDAKGSKRKSEQFINCTANYQDYHDYENVLFNLDSKSQQHAIDGGRVIINHLYHNRISHKLLKKNATLAES